MSAVGFDLDRAALNLPVGVFQTGSIFFQHCFGVTEFIFRHNGESFLLFQLFAELVERIHPEGNLQTFLLVGQKQEFLRFFRLDAQRLYAFFQLGHDILQAQEVIVSGLQLFLRFFLAVAELADTRCFFKNLAALIALDRNDFIDSSLSDDRVTVPSQAGIHQQFVDVFQTNCRGVDAVFAFAGAIELTGDGHLVAVHVEGAIAVVEAEGNKGVARWFSLVGAEEDNILHLFSAKTADRLLTHDPAHRIGNVALSAAVRANNGGDTLIEIQRRFFREGLEAMNL